MLSRVDRLRAEISALDMDAFLVTDLLNVRYLSGFTGSSAITLITRDDAILITDFRYAEQAAGECPGMLLELIESHWVTGAHRAIENAGARRIGFETHHMNHRDWTEMCAVLDDREMIPHDDLVGRLRYVKDDAEIALIKEAARISDEAFDHIVEFVKPGVEEREIALELEYFMRKIGAEKEAFETIAASGPRSALPHGRCSERRLGKGEFLVLDFGAKYMGYHSDITRTLMVGEPTDRHREIYSIVLDAQEKAIAAIRPGIPGGDVDAIARDYIASTGYGEYFGHGLGHGLGLDVHDGRLLGRRTETVLEPGMVVTVEPGIYLPGWGGVRIEDDVLITDSGAENLTTAPKAWSTALR